MNFDGLIGPTHNYAGLSMGNLASKNNAAAVSNPREAALQGLRKMRYVRDLGLHQGFIPPQQRPCLRTLRSFGFRGSDAEVIQAAGKKQPQLLQACYSASSMWTANAATVSPSADTADGRVHFSTANLNSMLHRSLEHKTTSALLKQIFSAANHFVHHDALIGARQFGDEGGANHGRLCADHGSAGVEMFVYGVSDFEPSPKTTFPARQSLEASQAIARRHQLSQSNTVFLQQNPAVIDAGVFHNDVVSVSNGHVLFAHENAFNNRRLAEQQLQQAAGELPLEFITVREEQVSLNDAVSSYLFNSQLLSVPGKPGMTLILPRESENNQSVARYVETLIGSGGTIQAADFIDVRQSMRNGGGPACLRLRVALNDDELAKVNPEFILSDARFDELCDWVGRHYRDKLAPADLLDPSLMIECLTALDELTHILKLGSFYDFQCG